MLACEAAGLTGRGVTSERRGDRRGRRPRTRPDAGQAGAGAARGRVGEEGSGAAAAEDVDGDGDGEEGLGGLTREGAGALQLHALGLLAARMGATGGGDGGEPEEAGVFERNRGGMVGAAQLATTLAGPLAAAAEGAVSDAARARAVLLLGRMCLLPAAGRSQVRAPVQEGLRRALDDPRREVRRLAVRAMAAWSGAGVGV